MCGRYSLHANPEVVSLLFGLSEIPAYQPRYNIAPTMPVLIVRQGEAVMVKWGLVPYWAKDLKGNPAMGAGMNNARAETVATKPSFRDAYRKRRCLIPASGFYEWQEVAGSKAKQPWYIHPREGELFAFAGLWESWNGPGGVLQTCAIITTEPNEVMAPIHERMPVIVAPADYSRWLGGDAHFPNPLLGPCPASTIAAYPVSKAVNRAANDSPDLLLPLDTGYNASTE